MDASNVGIQHGLSLMEGKAGHGGGRVLTNPRKGHQVVEVFRNLSTVAFDASAGCCMQTQRSARIPEPTPCTDRFGDRRLRQGGRGWPTFDPGSIDRQHAIDRRLLEHELADQDLPGRPRGCSPREVTSLGSIPGEQAVERRGHDLAIVTCAFCDPHEWSDP